MENSDPIVKRNALAKTHFFTDIPLDQLTELAEEFVWQEYPKGAEITKQGQKIGFFYVITEGKAESLVNRDGQDSLQMNYYEPGESFGELTLLTGQAANATIRCMTDCRVLALDATQFALMLIRWPYLNHKFIQQLAQRLRTAREFLWEAKYKEFLRSAMQLNRFQDQFYGIWGGKGTTAQIAAKIQELVHHPQHLLLFGESGTGRQMLAWFIHCQRFGESAPFVVISGKHFDRQWGQSIKNLLTIIRGGTLMVKEIHLLSPNSQVNLANCMRTEVNSCFLVGTVQTEQDKLQPELAYCLGQLYKIKPLRERKREIPVIAQGLLEKLAHKHHRNVPALDLESTRLLLSHHYRQANTTELIQIIERAFSLTKDDVIRPEHIFFGPMAQKTGQSVNLLSWAPLKALIHRGTFLSVLRGLISTSFILMIALFFLWPKSDLTALIFPLAWGLWWPALVIISPFIGRVWCTVCPFAAVMERVQKYFHWKKPVPDLLKKFDYVFVAFGFLFIFWLETVTKMRENPFATAMLLMAILLLAVLTGVVFARHTWCKNLCPIGGLVGTASIGSLLEVRADPNICLNKCTTLDCYVGSEKIPGCPMFQHLPYLDNNLDCKLCLQCVRNCPNESVQLNLRVPAQEVWNLVRVNQGYILFISMSLGILIPLFFFEGVRDQWPAGSWTLWFSLFYWGGALVAGGISWLLVRPYQSKAASMRVKLTFALIPLLLAGHIMYQVLYLPGLSDLRIHFSSISAGQTLAWNIPLTFILQILAALIGLLLSTFAIIMTHWHTKSNQKTTLMR